MKWFQGKRVVVPFDYSEASVNAVKVALQLAENKEDVQVVHVLLELPPTDPAAVWDTWNDEKRKNTSRASIEARLAEVDVHDVTIHVAVGVPGKVVADLAEELGAGIIVIPSHGYTGWKRFFLGSVTERVVRQAQCSVLVLKGEPTDVSS